MKKVYVFVEKTKNGFSCYTNDLKGMTSAGNTWEETKANFNQGLTSHLQLLKEYGDDIPEVFKAKYKLVFSLDAKQFFDYYNVFNRSKLAERIGINQDLLRHYIKGIRVPSEKQSLKIINGINNFAKELIIS